jgi:hypothetical protein
MTPVVACTSPSHMCSYVLTTITLNFHYKFVYPLKKTEQISKYMKSNVFFLDYSSVLYTLV